MFDRKCDDVVVCGKLRDCSLAAIAGEKSLHSSLRTRSPSGKDKQEYSGEKRMFKLWKDFFLHPRGGIHGAGKICWIWTIWRKIIWPKFQLSIRHFLSTLR